MLDLVKSTGSVRLDSAFASGSASSTLQVKEAVEKMFAGTKVESVNTMNLAGKKKRVRGCGFCSDYRVVLHDIVHIDRISPCRLNIANVSVYNIEGKEVGTIDLSDAIFGVEVNEHLLHMAVVNQPDQMRHR